jgi:hypothetical protein
LIQAVAQSRQREEIVTVKFGHDQLDEALATLNDAAVGDGLTFAFAVPGENEIIETCSFADNGDGPQVWRVNLTLG